MPSDHSLLSYPVIILPGLLLCIYVYYKDRVEKEPFSLLALLFGIGALSFLPCYFLRQQINVLILELFGGKVQYVFGTAYYASDSVGVLYELSRSFFGVSLIEEVMRWAALYFVTSRMKEFDCLFDGIVYSVFLALGFSAAETIRFTVYNGWDMLLSQTMTATGHVLFGIMMGFIYTVWHVYFLAAKEEKKRFEEGSVSARKIRSPFFLLLLSFLSPLILHTVFDFSARDEMNLGSAWADPVCRILFTVTYLACFAAAYAFSKRDGENEALVSSILRKKHPELVNRPAEGQNGDDGNG